MDLHIKMRKKLEIGPVEEEFICKHGMKERLIEAYKITVKIFPEEKEDYNATHRFEQTTCSNLCKSVII